MPFGFLSETAFGFAGIPNSAKDPWEDVHESRNPSLALDPNLDRDGVLVNGPWLLDARRKCDATDLVSGEACQATRPTLLR